MNTNNITTTLAIAAAIALAACGADERRSPDGASQAPNRTSTPETQGDRGSSSSACLEAYCDGELSACDAGCRELIDCASACADSGCVDRCVARQPPTVVDATFNLVDCFDAFCDTETPSTGGSGANCLDDECGFELSACSADIDCVVLAQCLGGCSTQACADQCVGNKSALSQQRMSALLQCSSARCG